jgi:pyruvate/2-oxoglutarate dehydrogenase complex dihydrolipoamide dehydrogenase (E3) component
VGIRIRVEERVVTGSHLLVAAGRLPNTDRLDFPAARVEVDERGYVRVNERRKRACPACTL